MSDELAAHLEMHIDDNVRAGMSLEEARRAALLNLGGVEQTKESMRDRRGLRFLENLARDLRLGFRSLQRNRGLSFIAILALTLGIGATTIMFSVIYGVVVDALPYRNFERSVVFRQNLVKCRRLERAQLSGPTRCELFANKTMYLRKRSSTTGYVYSMTTVGLCATGRRAKR